MHEILSFNFLTRKIIITECTKLKTRQAPLDSVIALSGVPLMGQTPISENTLAKYKASHRYIL